MASPAALPPQLSHVTLGSASSVPVHHAFINIHVTPNTTAGNAQKMARNRSPHGKCTRWLEDALRGHAHEKICAGGL